MYECSSVERYSLHTCRRKERPREPLPSSPALQQAMATAAAGAAASVTKYCVPLKHESYRMHVLYKIGWPQDSITIHTNYVVDYMVAHSPADKITGPACRLASHRGPLDAESSTSLRSLLNTDVCHTHSSSQPYNYLTRSALWPGVFAARATIAAESEFDQQNSTYTLAE